MVLIESILKKNFFFKETETRNKYKVVAPTHLFKNSETRDTLLPFKFFSIRILESLNLCASQSYFNYVSTSTHS